MTRSFCATDIVVLHATLSGGLSPFADSHRWSQLQNWWRRRESNPRPQALHSQDYMLSLVIWASPCARQPAGWRSASRFDGSTRGSGHPARRGWCEWRCTPFREPGPSADQCSV